LLDYILYNKSFKFLAFLGNDVILNDEQLLYFSILLFKLVISSRDVTNAP